MAEAGNLNMRLGCRASGRMMMCTCFMAKWANEGTSFNQAQLITLTYDINPSLRACIIYIN